MSCCRCMCVVPRRVWDYVAVSSVVHVRHSVTRLVHSTRRLTSVNSHVVRSYELAVCRLLVVTTQVRPWRTSTALFECLAALFYSPVDFTDASDLHQTVVKFIGWSIESDKITLLNIKFNQENCQQKDTPLILKQMSRRMIDSPRCRFIAFIGLKFDASMHTSVRCIGEINRWIKQRSLSFFSTSGHNHNSDRHLLILEICSALRCPCSEMAQRQCNTHRPHTDDLFANHIKT